MVEAREAGLGVIRIWVDGQCFQSASNVRGIGRYVAELLRAIHVHGNTELIISLNGNLADEAIAARRFLENLLPGAKLHVWFGIAADGEGDTGRTPMRLADARILVDHVNRLAPDIALSPSLFEGFDDRTVPLFDTAGLLCPAVCIFHDAIPHRYPERYFHNPLLTEGYYRRLLAVARFDLVLCNSEFTADECRDILEIDNCISIAAGLAESFIDALSVPDEAVDMPFGLPDRYVLYVGGLDWRKNVPTLITAMSLLPDVRNGELRLVLAGGGGNEMAALKSQWASQGLPDAGLVTGGWLSDAQLVKCYRHAAVAVQPSLMEGFGLAALEAMAVGCPFLASRGGAVGEVIGNPEQLFDGADCEALAHLINRVMIDAAFTRSIVAAGRERTRLFSWGRSASLALEAVGRLLGAMQTTARGGPPQTTSPVGRVVMDVTSTAQSPMHSGIQRVIRRLSEAMTASVDGVPTVLGYSDDVSGWYQLAKAYPYAINRDPRERIDHRAGDIHFMLDSSWGLPHIHRPRLRDALVLGQDVVHGVHDIGPLTMPAMTVPSMPRVFGRWFEFILGYSTGIICVSRATADEIHAMIRAIRLPRPMNIGFIQLGADFAEDEPEDNWFDFAGDGPVFLMVGTIEPRKGHAMVIDAFDRHWAAGGRARLLLIGKPGWNTRQLDLRLRHHPQIGKRLFMRSDVSDAQLRGAYQTAHALIMASWLEGFGLPVVEAGQLGCPVILSDLPVFREVSEGAPEVDFFPVGDSAALLRCVETSIGRGARKHGLPPMEWPNWQETSRQVYGMLAGNRWYKRYVPDEIAANAVPGVIGEMRMMSALDEADQRYSTRYIDGPLVSDDGDEVQITVAIRNEGSRLWTSRPGPTDGFQINVASHIVDGHGELLTAENPRAAIPFAMPPGQEILFPIRISTDWLARGAHAVEIVMVQELVARFGVPFTVPINQRFLTQVGPRTSDLARTRLQILRQPWAVADQPGCHLVLAVINTGDLSIAATIETLREKLVVTASRGIGVARGDWDVVSAFNWICPGDVGLLTLRLSEQVLAKTEHVRFEFAGQGDGGLTIHL